MWCHLKYFALCSVKNFHIQVHKKINCDTEEGGWKNIESKKKQQKSEMQIFFVDLGSQRT